MFPAWPGNMVYTKFQYIIDEIDPRSYFGGINLIIISCYGFSLWLLNQAAMYVRATLSHLAESARMLELCKKTIVILKRNKIYLEVQRDAWKGAVLSFGLILKK